VVGTLSFFFKKQDGNYAVKNVGEYYCNLILLYGWNERREIIFPLSHTINEVCKVSQGGD